MQQGHQGRLHANMKNRNYQTFNVSYSLGGFVKIQMAGSPRLISNKVPGDAHTTGLGYYTL